MRPTSAAAVLHSTCLDADARTTVAYLARRLNTRPASREAAPTETPDGCRTAAASAGWTWKLTPCSYLTSSRNAKALSSDIAAVVAAKRAADAEPVPSYFAAAAVAGTGSTLSHLSERDLVGPRHAGRSAATLTLECFDRSSAWSRSGTAAASPGRRLSTEKAAAVVGSAYAAALTALTGAAAVASEFAVADARAVESDAAAAATAE